MFVNKDVNDWIENRACKLLNKFCKDYYCARNNLNSNDIDIKISNKNNEYKIDAQYSFNFQKYGDIRLDYVSAGILNEKYKNKTTLELNKIINLSKDENNMLLDILSVKKYGKYFEDNGCLGVIYFLYKNGKPKNLDKHTISHLPIDKIIFLPTEIITEELKTFNKTHTYKINDKQKNNLIESHESAFVCINVNKICEKYNIPIFSSNEELTQLNEIIDKYFKNMTKTKPKSKTKP